MQNLIQKKIDILNKIDAIIEKIETVEDDTSFSYRQQIQLILSNLSSSLKNCDERYLLKQLLENISNNVSNIESNVKTKSYSSVQGYLTELLKSIAFLNNANGKHNLQGYQSAVNKNIRLLEQEIQKSVSRLKELDSLISEKSNSFSETEDRIEKQIEEYRTAHENELEKLTDKYEKFIAELSKKQDDSQKTLIEEQQKFKKEYSDEIIKLKEDISKIKTDFQNDSTNSLSVFEVEKSEKIENLEKEVNDFIEKVNIELNELKASATEKLGHIAAATYSSVYKKYSDKARTASRLWYTVTLISLICLIALSIWWFVFKQYSNSDYVLLISRICATIGFAVVSRYSAIQASKNKVMETKLRKIQLQISTFDAFVSSLNKEEQDKLKIELTHKLTEQEDWLTHDKNEIDSFKDIEKIIRKAGYKIEINQMGNSK